MVVEKNEKKNIEKMEKKTKRILYIVLMIIFVICIISSCVYFLRDGIFLSKVRNSFNRTRDSYKHVGV